MSSLSRNPKYLPNISRTVKNLSKTDPPCLHRQNFSEYALFSSASCAFDLLLFFSATKGDTVMIDVRVDDCRSNEKLLRYRRNGAESWIRRRDKLEGKRGGGEGRESGGPMVLRGLGFVERETLRVRSREITLVVCGFSYVQEVTMVNE